MTYSAEVLADSPLVYWRLGDASGTTMTDSSGNSRNGTYNSSPSLGETGLIADANTAVKFLASGTQWASLANAAWMNLSGDFTIECWVKPAVSVTAGSARIYAVKYDVSGGGNGFYLCIDSTGKPTFGLRFAGTDVTISDASAVTLGNVYHLVGVRSGTSSLFYLNGTLVGSATNSGTPGAAAVTFGVAALAGVGQYADATLDEVAYYGSALSAGRVAAHYGAGLGTVLVSGEAFASAATMLDGSALTAIQVAGEAFGAAVTMLDGVVVGTTITGEAFASAVTMLDGGPVGPAITVAGESFSGSVTVLDGAVVAGTDMSNALDGLDIVFTGTVTVERPPAEAPASLVLGEKYDKAIAYPVPVMVDGRPT